MKIITLLFLAITTNLLAQSPIDVELLTRADSLSEEIQDIKDCMAIKKDYTFVGRAPTLNGFEGAQSVFTFNVPRRARYYITVNGVGSVSPLSAVFIAKNGNLIKSDYNTASDKTHNTSTFVGADEGDVIEVRATRNGGPGYGVFDIDISLECVTILK